MRTNLEIAKELYTLSKGLNEILKKRKTFADSPEDATLTFNLTGARDKASRLATELAQDEAIQQEQDKLDDQEDVSDSTFNK